MTFWQKKTGGEGWTAAVFGTNRIAVANVTRARDAQPRVLAYDNFSREGSELEALKRLKTAKRLAQNRCTTLLWHGQYQLLQVDAPTSLPENTPHEEMREAMRWRIKEMVDFPIEQAAIDVLNIPVQGARTPQLWVVAASRDVLRPRVQLFQDAKVPLAAIDIPELAQRNLAALFEEPNRGLALVAFNDKGGLLTVSYQGELYMTRHIDVSGPELTANMSNLGNNSGGANVGALQERVLLDIQRSLDSFDRNFSAIPLTRLGVGPLPGGAAFIEYLGGNLSLPVASADLAEVMDFTATPRLKDTAAQAEAWLALGAALRDR
jgi:MSHA biogenesis protein MshI